MLHQQVLTGFYRTLNSEQSLALLAWNKHAAALASNYANRVAIAGLSKRDANNKECKEQLDALEIESEMLKQEMIRLEMSFPRIFLTFKELGGIRVSLQSEIESFKLGTQLIDATLITPIRLWRWTCPVCNHTNTEENYSDKDPQVQCHNVNCLIRFKINHGSCV